MTRDPAVIGKADKASVDYSPGHPAERCGICKHYIELRTPQGSCALVKGPIDPYYWCKLFER